MNTAQPIRNAKDLENIKSYYVRTKPNKRNCLLITIGLNTALRVSDILALRWRDVYDFEQGRFKEHIRITEKKTDKSTVIYMNRSIREALSEYRQHLKEREKEAAPDRYLFKSQGDLNRPISRVQAFRIIKEAADKCHIEGVISCHSLRKTFGYHAWKQGVTPVLLMNIYNHSSFQVTSRYLGIEQDDRDKIFESINL